MPRRRPSILFYGAKSLALGMCKAVRELYPEYPIMGFLVTSREGNPAALAGLPVWDIESFHAGVGEEEKDGRHILIATPEDLHPEIVRTIESLGYHHFTCMDSAKEARLMERYFKRLGLFPSVRGLEPGRDKAGLWVVMARFHKDRDLKSDYRPPEWVRPLQVGAALTDARVAELLDNMGENVSAKNVNYCELTGLYWLWKNRLSVDPGGEGQYYGLFHYRRILDITEADLYRLGANDVDAVLQFPTLHEPSILEHHARYIPESDWEAMERALAELRPEYAKALPAIMAQPYFYNYNLIIAKRRVLADYCAWLFPILERTEALSTPKGWERRDRYIGYLGESLMTLYFLYHKKDLKIYHAGRLMLT